MTLSTPIPKNQAKQNLKFALTGWFNPAMDLGYFPQDLPEDWRWGFYMNQFDDVLLYQHEAKQLQPSDLQELTQEASASFTLWLQLEADDANAWLEDFVLALEAHQYQGALVVMDPELTRTIHHSPSFKLKILGSCPRLEDIDQWQQSPQALMPCVSLKHLPASPKQQLALLRQWMATPLDGDMDLTPIIFVDSQMENLNRMDDLMLLAQMAGF